MARFKYYRYGMKQDGRLPKTGFVRFDEFKIPTGYKAVAIYDHMLSDREIAKYKLTDFNEPVSKLTRARNNFGMKQADLAEITGLSVRTIQGWELYGMSGAAISKAYRVADVLHCSLEDLLEDDDLNWRENIKKGKE